MTRILLVRHGHVEGISPERFRGRRDVDLSDLGRRQADATARRIAAQSRPAAIYTSPLRRCVQTAAAIGAACGLSPGVLDDLNDLHYGDWEWLTHEEARAESPDLFECWFAAPQLVRFPNGESLQDVVARTANVLRLVRERHRDATVVVVGHSSGNRALLLQTLDQPLSAYWRLGQDPCSLSEIELFEHHASVRRLNETCFLPP
ncbi:MAG TPA: histidine phosphatase family protein [Steroidobacteraceae bacterium]|jgi:probable phosphoglycerate mutase|nr:histidine phosphatase family protein [Steroidobacteraceae bacterium]